MHESHYKNYTYTFLVIFVYIICSNVYNEQHDNEQYGNEQHDNEEHGNEQQDNEQ